MGLYARILDRGIDMTPEDIIADELAKEFPSASGVLSALAAKGFYIMKLVPDAPIAATRQREIGVI